MRKNHSLFLSPDYSYKCLQCLCLHTVRWTSHEKQSKCDEQILDTMKTDSYIGFPRLKVEVSQGWESRKQFLLGWPWRCQVITPCIDFRPFLQFSKAILNYSHDFSNLCQLAVFCKHHVFLQCQIQVTHERLERHHHQRRLVSPHWYITLRASYQKYFIDSRFLYKFCIHHTINHTS